MNARVNRGGLVAGMRAAGSPCSFIVRLSALRSRHLHVQLFSRDFLGLAIVEHCRPSACLPLAGRADSRPHLSRDREGRHARLPYRPEAGRNVGAVREEFPRLRRTEPGPEPNFRNNRPRGASGKAGRRNAISAYVIRSWERSRTLSAAPIFPASTALRWQCMARRPR
jgi:hypothetical protein